MQAPPELKDLEKILKNTNIKLFDAVEAVLVKDGKILKHTDSTGYYSKIASYITHCKLNKAKIEYNSKDNLIYFNNKTFAYEIIIGQYTDTNSKKSILEKANNIQNKFDKSLIDGILYFITFNKNQSDFRNNIKNVITSGFVNLKCTKKRLPKALETLQLRYGFTYTE